MSVNLSIKGVSAPIAAQLRARAARNHRSLQGELMAIVTAAATENTQHSSPATTNAPARHGWKTLEQVAAEGRERHRRPVSRFGRSVDLIRQMRDSR